MGAKVTDPALLAELEGRQKVTDPALLADLEGSTEPSLGDRVTAFAKGLLPPSRSPIGHALDALTGGAYGEIAPRYGGLYQPPEVLPQRRPVESNKEYGLRVAHEQMIDPGAPDRALATAALIGGGGPEIVGAKQPSILPQAVRDYVLRKSIAQGRRVLTGGAEPLAVKKPLSPEATQAAFDVGAISPGRTTEYAAKILKAARAAKAGELGSIIDELEAAGVKGPDALALARELRKKADVIERNTADSGAPEIYRKIADELESKLKPYSPQGPTSPELELSQAESIKRSLQQKATYDRVQGDTIKEAARKDIASDVRQAVEDAISNQSSLAPEAAASFVPAKRDLANLIEASNAAKKGAAQAARRNAFSLRDMLIGSGASAGGAASLGPLGALAGPVAAIGSKVARTRGTPTVAWLLNKTAKAGARPLPSGAGTLGPMAQGLPLGSPRVSFSPAAAEPTPSQPESSTETGSPGSGGAIPATQALRAALGSPDTFGKYYGILSRAASEGDEALAARHFTLYQSDPEYQRLVAPLLGAAP